MMVALQAAYFALDLIAPTVLMMKVCYWRNTRGLSQDMLVCSTIAACVFPLISIDKILQFHFSLSLFFMCFYAFALIYILYTFAHVSPKLAVRFGSKANPRVPLLCRWPVCLGASMVLGIFLAPFSVAPVWLLVPLYLEALAKGPQLWLFMDPSSRDPTATLVIVLMILSRVVEASSWVLVFSLNDLVILTPIIIQLFCAFDFVYLCARQAAALDCENRNMAFV